MSNLKEGTDYELIPSPEHDDAWAVRILTGDYVESIIVYETIAFNEVQDCLTFNFSVISSPESKLNAADVELQQYAANLLESVIEKGIDEGYVQIEDKDNASQS